MVVSRDQRKGGNGELLISGHTPSVKQDEDALGLNIVPIVSKNVFCLKTLLRFHVKCSYLQSNKVLKINKVNINLTLHYLNKN